VLLIGGADGHGCLLRRAGQGRLPAPTVPTPGPVQVNGTGPLSAVEPNTFLTWAAALVRLHRILRAA
jgi:hypothetical protein